MWIYGMKMKKIFCLAAALVMLALSTACAAGGNQTKDGGDKKMGNRIAIFATSMGTFEIELFEDKAPKTTANFITLAEKGFYDGLIFHRVIDGFMIQGGDPKGNGMGGPNYSIKGEFQANGVPNPLKHTYGVLSMARSSQPDSAGSQFFIMVSAAPHLDGQYAAFGKVLSGMETADAIVMQPRDMRDRPLEPVVIKSIRVDTEGHTYPFDQY